VSAFRAHIWHVALLAGALAASAASAPACSSDPAPPAPARACGLSIWHKPASREAHVEIVAEWNGWTRPGIVPEEHEGGWRVATFDLPPGEHAYAIVEDGVWIADRNVPITGFHEGREVALAEVPDCQRPQLRVDEVNASEDGHATIRASFLAAGGGAPGAGLRLDPASIRATSRSGATFTVTAADAATGAVILEATGLAKGKHAVALHATDLRGAEAEEAIATVWIEREAWDPRDAIVYQVFLDRFRDENGALATPERPSDRAGGNLEGFRRAIESGELEAFGVNTVWLSPLYANPTGDYLGNDGRPYTSYHGYWPIDSRALDDRFATEAELERFVDDAHRRGIRVLFDVVPNHVHEDHPWAREHPERFNDGCLCGQGSCDWGKNIRTCQFAPYLPDLDWTNPDVARETTADVMWWLDRWDGDGLRIDAVPMMPRSATRRIASAARARYAHPGNVPYILGENFTGPGAFQSLRYDLGPFGLDGSFHFPLMWTLRQAIAEERAPMSEIEATFRAGEEAWDGAGAVMGLMIGNHDVSRFASVSAGNAAGDAWISPPQPVDPAVYAKQRLGLAAVFTLPGAPVLYYGDEVGLAGRSDPDCRRVMPAEEVLIPAQRETRAMIQKVGRARACSKALRRGNLRTLLADNERLVYARVVDDEEGRVVDAAVVVLTRRPSLPTTVTLPPGIPPALFDVVSGEAVHAADGALPVDNAPFGVKVYVPAAEACAGR
jgi:glycosidase